MLVALALNWPFLLFRAGLGVIIGIGILLWPDLEPSRLALMFGAYAFSDGILALVLALSVRDMAGFGSLLLEAVTRTIISLMIIASPAAAAAKLVDIFTAWTFLSAISAFLIALALRRDVTGAWPLPFAGVMSLIFGITLRLAPPPPTSLPLIIGGYSLLFGFTVLALTLRLRQLSFDIAGH
jgi:uncharacterized membrane protein HdeD (DUF308 family)